MTRSQTKLSISIVSFVLAALFFLACGFFVELPYHKWLAGHLPTWLAIVNVIIFGLCIVAAATSLTRRLYLIAVTAFGVLSMLVLRVSFKKAPLVNGIIVLVAVLLYAVLKKLGARRRATRRTGARI
jgi:TctA family transporter